MSNCQQWGDAEEDWKISRIFDIHFNIRQRVIEWGRGYLSQPHSPPLCLFLTGHNSISKWWLLCQGAANYRKNIHYIVIERLWICNHYHQYRVIAMSCGFHENASYAIHAVLELNCHCVFLGLQWTCTSRVTSQGIV